MRKCVCANVEVFVAFNQTYLFREHFNRITNNIAISNLIIIAYVR